MNIAFSSLVLFLLFVPGILFRRFYFTEEFSKQYFTSSFTELLTSSFFPGVFVHLIILTLVYPFGYSVDFDILGLILLGDNEHQSISTIFQNIEIRSIEILTYFIGASTTGAVLGRMAKAIVRRGKWDRRYKLLRFKNEWHYLFSGEVLEFPRVSGSFEEVDFRYVDALVQTNEGVFIYNGFLEDYILSKDGGIDRIYLSDVRRRPMVADKAPKKKEDKRYYSLPGKFFVLPYAQVLNLHIVYYSIKELE